MSLKHTILPILIICLLLSGCTQEGDKSDTEPLLEAFKNTLAEKLSSGEITQEEYDDAIAKMESGEFTFGGKAFKGMKGEKPETFSFDSEHFQNMKDKLSEMTDEEKAAMLENLKAAEGDHPFAAKFAGFPKAGVRMMGKSSAETENEA